MCVKCNKWYVGLSVSTVSCGPVRVHTPSLYCMHAWRRAQTRCACLRLPDHRAAAHHRRSLCCLCRQKSLCCCVPSQVIVLLRTIASGLSGGRQARCAHTYPSMNLRSSAQYARLAARLAVHEVSSCPPQGGAVVPSRARHLLHKSNIAWALIAANQNSALRGSHLSKAEQWVGRRCGETARRGALLQ